MKIIGWLIKFSSITSERFESIPASSVHCGVLSYGVCLPLRSPLPYIYSAIWRQFHGQLSCGMIQVLIGLNDFIFSPFSYGQSLR